MQPRPYLFLQVDKVNALEPEMQSLSDQQLAAKTAELKQRAQGKGESLDSLLPEAFAVSARPGLLYREQSAALSPRTAQWTRVCQRPHGFIRL